MPVPAQTPPPTPQSQYLTEYDDPSEAFYQAVLKQGGEKQILLQQDSLASYPVWQEEVAAIGFLKSSFTLGTAINKWSSCQWQNFLSMLNLGSMWYSGHL